LYYNIFFELYTCFLYIRFCDIIFYNVLNKGAKIMFEKNSGITKPMGFVAAGVVAGIKKNHEPDLALLVSQEPCIAAGLFTKNSVKGHALKLSMEHINNKSTKAVVINSGNANACNGKRGVQDAVLMAGETAKATGCDIKEVLLGSTGVIGVPLNMDKIKNGINTAATELRASGGNDAAKAIMTTDTHEKEYSVQFEINNRMVTIGGMAKGSGMIHPNMATMISVLTTDANINKKALDTALRSAARKSFNRISVDGDTSVCDMVIILANGLADNDEIQEDSESFKVFCSKLDELCIALSKMLVTDGEGATKLIEINVVNAKTGEDAFKAVNSIAKSPLVKTAFFGEDANWGRLITALGYSGAEFNPETVDMKIGDMYFCKNGGSVEFDEYKAKKILIEKEITVTIDLNDGNCSDRIWTCDLSDDYVEINGSYRT
jgi:glutamate N-acetyltransferase/amino-acid N-acetyltransferase